MSVGTQRSAKTMSSQTESSFLCDSPRFFPVPPSFLLFLLPSSRSFLRSHPFSSQCSLFFHPPPSPGDLCLPPFPVSVATFAPPPPPFLL